MAGSSHAADAAGDAHPGPADRAGGGRGCAARQAGGDGGREGRGTGGAGVESRSEGRIKRIFQDEERHVFPRLLASNDATLVQCVKTLQRQHHEMAEAWQKLRALLMAVQQGDAGGLLGQAAFVDSFVALYQAHIALEEGTAFPAGFADMPPDQRTQMGKEMAARRGATRLSSKG